MRMRYPAAVLLVGLSAANAVAREGEPILFAANRGDLAEVKRILARDPSKAKFREPSEGFTPLIYAAREGRGEVVAALLAAGADASAQNKSGDSALIYASMNGHLPVVKALLEVGANPDPKRGYRSALMAAARNGFEDVVGALLEGGADVERVIGSSTALRKAILGQHRRIAEMLLRKMKGCEVFLAAMTNDVAGLRKAAARDAAALKRERKIEKVAPIHMAALGDAAGATAFLLENGVDVAVWNGDFATPLHIAAGAGSVKAAKVLIDAGAPLEAVDVGGYSPLLLATKKAKAATVKVLAEAGADAALPGYEGRPALHAAAYEADLASVNALLECGADVNAVSMEGDTPLHIAAERAAHMSWCRDRHKQKAEDYEAVAKLLLAKGASTRMKDARGRAASQFGAARISTMIRERETRSPAAKRVPDPAKVPGVTKLTSLGEAKERGHVVVLVPIGGADVALLRDLAADLRILLGVTVLTETTPVTMPEPKGSTRKRGGRQWTFYSLRAALKKHIGYPGRKKVGVLGVASDDIFNRGTNYIFASAHRGVGVMSYRRFITDDRARLLKRMRNQGVASTASMFNVDRCRNAHCPCAYTQSLRDHDMKGSRLCDECGGGFKKVFGVRGGTIPDPEDVEPEDSGGEDVF